MVKDPSVVQQVQKKREVLDMIDAFATKTTPIPSAASTNASANFVSPKRIRHPEHRYDPVTRDHIRPETYWNDWYIEYILN